MKKYELYNGYKIVFSTSDDGYSYFFGYYDKSPLNINSTKLLVHRVSFDGRDVRDGDVAEVGYFNLKTKEFIKIDETLAWNWQQGSQLQWLPPRYDEEVIYNSIVEDKFVSFIYNINTHQKKLIPFPIYVVHPNGKEALGVNYERLYWCRPGYNYQNIKNKKWKRPYHEEDGIYKINLETGKVKLIVKITDIINNQKLPEFETSNNWLEHMMYNPSGDRFMFFHRWHKNGIDYSRIYTANSNNGEGLFMYPDTRFYSHYYWQDDNTITIWSKNLDEIKKGIGQKIDNLKKNIFIKNLIKKIYKPLKPYLPYQIKSILNTRGLLYNLKDKTNEHRVVGAGILEKMALYGHQSWFNDKKRLLIDTYQDIDSYRYLIIFDTGTNNFNFIGKFYSLYNDSGFRCDLHPRLSNDNKFVVIDTAYEQRRKVLLISID